ncbi:hypothetical protein JL721_12749 [Aureococcus anophagefferens]|nr:hypothetical protein JL721_12749 [Aureococcus anophagefferens]
MKAALLALLSTGSALRVPRRAVAGAVAGALTTPYVPLAARAADAPTRSSRRPSTRARVTERKINVQEGDAAAAAMKALGNTGPYEMLKKEAYEARFQPSRPSPWSSGTSSPSRGASSVSVSGDVLSFAAKDGTKHALKLVDRKSEDIGRGQIGYTETYIIDGKVAAKLSRGFRPAPAAPMFGGTEKVETFDVTNGAIGATPTSTTKSRLQYERPEVAQRTGFGRWTPREPRLQFYRRGDGPVQPESPPPPEPEDALGDDLDAEDERRLASLSVSGAAAAPGDLFDDEPPRKRDRMV